MLNVQIFMEVILNLDEEIYIYFSMISVLTYSYIIKVQIWYYILYCVL